MSSKFYQLEIKRIWLGYAYWTLFIELLIIRYVAILSIKFWERFFQRHPCPWLPRSRSVNRNGVPRWTSDRGVLLRAQHIQAGKVRFESFRIARYQGQVFNRCMGTYEEIGRGKRFGVTPGTVL